MKTAEIIYICKSVLDKLSKMDNEVIGPQIAANQLIFPQKQQQRGSIIRFSEQELRLLFIDEFKKNHPDLFYSIETPTKEKYRFQGSLQNFTTGNINHQSGSTDLTIFKKNNAKYTRILNIEFKFKGNLDSIGKDIFKLIQEEVDGAFIHLLKNSDKGTFCNANQSRGLFRRFHDSIHHFQNFWSNPDKTLLIVFLSMERHIGIYRIITKADLKKLDSIFLIKQSYGKIDALGWNPI